MESIKINFHYPNNMSHVLEEYAKNLGVLISKPIVSKHYFPLVEDKYITIFSEEEIQSKNYKHYDMVLELLRPFLSQKNIKVIQIDTRGKQIKGVNKVIGGLSFKQYAYLISKSIMHVGIDNIYSHYASSENIPIVNLFGNVYPSISNGYWSDNDKRKDIAAPWSLKPSLSHQDPNSEINLIKPEIIAQSILDLLGEKVKINFKTQNIGSMFSEQIYEVIPTSFHPLPKEHNDIIFLRADYGINPEAFIEYCSKYKVAIISDQLIQLSIIDKFKNNINKISLLIDKNYEEIPEKYFEILKTWNISVQILVKDENDLAYLKNKYFDQDVYLYQSKKDKIKGITKKSLFLSNKKIFKDGKFYASKAHLDIGKNLVDSKMNVIDTHEYWQEQDHFYIYEQT